MKYTYWSVKGMDGAAITILRKLQGNDAYQRWMPAQNWWSTCGFMWTHKQLCYWSKPIRISKKQLTKKQLES